MGVQFAPLDHGYGYLIDLCYLICVDLSILTLFGPPKSAKKFVLALLNLALFLCLIVNTTFIMAAPAVILTLIRG